MHETNICIIGAGPAGTAAALRLSYGGVPSVLIDKATFPREKVCGDGISGKIPMLLERLDPQMLERFLENTTIHNKVWGIRFVNPAQRVVDLPIKADYDKNSEQAPGFVCERFDFDQFFINEVQARDNITMHQGITISNYERTANGWLITGNKGMFQLRCKLLLIANGANSHFSRHIAGHEKENAHYAAAVRTYFTGVTGFHADNFIELHYLKQFTPGYFWAFPAPNGRANAGIYIRSDYVSKHQLNLRQMLDDFIQNDPLVKDRFKHAEQVGKTKGYGMPLGSKKRKLSGHAYMLLGDAGHLIDPLTGEGIGNAFYSGFIAAEQAVDCIQHNRFDADYLKAYDVRIDRVLRAEMRLSYRLQSLMKYTWLINFLSNFMADHPKMIEVLAKMYEDFEFRKKLLHPSFWVKLWRNRKNAL